MTTFEYIMIAFSFLSLLGGLIFVYNKTQVDIAKIQTSILFLQKDLDNKEKSILHLELNNREDHKIILCKIDELIKMKC